jgi:ABC-type xylose transport system permease subunit
VKHPVKKQNMDTKTKYKEPNYNIYIMFIVIVILSIFLWYTYGSQKNLSHDNLSFISTPNLVMLSPDFGNGSRFGSL